MKRLNLNVLIYLLIAFLPQFYETTLTSTKTAVENDYPIIGILTQEISYYLNKLYPDQYESYIAASYVKFVESGGARVAPIWIGKPQEYYEEIVPKLNGVLFPGGATYFNQSNGYAEAGNYIYSIAKKLNDKGIYFPIWGTCLGMELLTYLSANGVEHRSHCHSLNQPLPLEFKEGFNNSRLFGSAPRNVIDILSKENVTANYHQFCVTQQNLTELGLNKKWKILSINHDWDNAEFVSTIEHKKYPFYGVQYHPEKNMFEWIKNRNLTHTKNSIKTSQYFAEFFVNEARKNDNHFSDQTEEFDNLIYNYAPAFTGRKKMVFYQSYLFDSETSKTNTGRISVNLIE